METKSEELKNELKNGTSSSGTSSGNGGDAYTNTTASTNTNSKANMAVSAVTPKQKLRILKAKMQSTIGSEENYRGVGGVEVEYVEDEVAEEVVGIGRGVEYNALQSDENGRGERGGGHADAVSYIPKPSKSKRRSA